MDILQKGIQKAVNTKTMSARQDSYPRNYNLRTKAT